MLSYADGIDSCQREGVLAAIVGTEFEHHRVIRTRTGSALPALPASPVGSREVRMSAAAAVSVSAKYPSLLLGTASSTTLGDAPRGAVGLFPFLARRRRRRRAGGEKVVVYLAQYRRIQSIHR